MPDTLADLHYRLGKKLEERPGMLSRPDGGAPFNTNDRCFEGLAIETAVNMDASARLDRIAQEARAEMGEERWQELQKEWDE